MSEKSGEEILSTPLHGIYIPCALLIVGVAIIDWRFTPVAALVAFILAAFKVWRGRKFSTILNVFL